MQPFAWLWQELRAFDGYPWYGEAYTVAIEPSTSYPAQGLAAVLAKTQTQQTLAGGESRVFTTSVSLYETTGNLIRVEQDGTPVLEQGTA